MGAVFASSTTGFGDNIFGAEKATEPEDNAIEQTDADVEAEEPPLSDDESDSASTSSSTESLVVALTSTSISQSPLEICALVPSTVSIDGTRVFAPVNIEETSGREEARRIVGRRCGGGRECVDCGEV